MSEKKDFLLEIGTEEMPSAPLIHASKQYRELLAKGLDDAGLAHGDIKIVTSPRRLGAVIADVAIETEEVHEV